MNDNHEKLFIDPKTFDVDPAIIPHILILIPSNLP